MPANEFASECRFSLGPLHEDLAPEDITLGVYPEWLFPLIGGECAVLVPVPVS